MSLTSVDLPEPDTPVTATKHTEREGDVDVAQIVLAGALDHVRARALLGLCRRFVRHLDPPPAGQVLRRSATRSEASRSSTVPETTISPPCSPASGPMSTTQSAVRMVSSSCSTTIRVLPRFFSRTSVSIRRWLSRWCSPIDGSSSTYSTPTRPEPIWVARPDPLGLAAGEGGRRPVQRQVVQTDVDQEPEPGVHLLQHPFGDGLLAAEQLRTVRKNSLASPMDSAAHLGDGPPADGHGQDLGLEPGAAAGRARHLAHVALVLLARPVALGLGVAALDPGDHALRSPA